jgi:hypothetical protein
VAMREGIPRKEAKEVRTQDLPHHMHLQYCFVFMNLWAVVQQNYQLVPIDRGTFDYYGC